MTMLDEHFLAGSFASTGVAAVLYVLKLIYDAVRNRRTDRMHAQASAVEETVAANGALSSTITTLTSEVGRLTKENRELRSENRKLHGEMADLRSQVNDRTRELAELQARFADMSARLDKLQT